MKSKIILGLLASTMMVSAASATLVSNGGKPQYSLTEIQTKIDDGSFYNYAGVVKLINGVRVGGGSGFLFTKTFAPGMALPEIKDVAALQRALAKKDETILVASNEWILPVPAIFVELGKQNGVDGATFMEHYITATTDVSQDDFSSFAAAQTKAVVDAIGVQTVTVDTKPLVDAGILTELAAEKLNGAMLTTMLNDAKSTIERLGAEYAAGLVAEYNRGFAEGVASVDITSDNQAAFNKGAASVDITSDNGIAKRDAHARGQREGFSAGVSAGRASANSESFSNGFAAGRTVGEFHAYTTVERRGVAANQDVQALTTQEIVDLKGVTAPHIADTTSRAASNALSTLSVAEITVNVTAAIEQAANEAYSDGYEDGYADGYADGFSDGVASTQR